MFHQVARFPKAPELGCEALTYKASYDRFLFIEISILILFGLLMVYSASVVVAAQRGEPSGYFLRQSKYAAVGFLLMILLMFIDYHVWLKQKMVLLLSVLSASSLMLVFAQSPIKGAHRWLRLGSLSFQPSELAKLVILFYLAFYLQKHLSMIKKPGFRLLPCLTYIGLFAGLIGAEPDFGQALCIIILAGLLLFIAGLDWKYICSAIVPSLPAFYFFVWEVPYRRERILAWWAALRDILTAPYHPKQAGIAVGRGGLFGVGLGKSRQKFNFLPEAFGDFIYAVIGEEFGLIGTALVAAAFLCYLCLGLKISNKAPDNGGFYLGLGITLMVALQAFIHISAVLAIVPAKGLTLPFISQGGSSLLVCLMAAGVLLNISTQRKTTNEDR